VFFFLLLPYTTKLFLSMTDVESRDLWLQTELEELA